jgi:DHA1 family inner membrane transport protein
MFTQAYEAQCASVQVHCTNAHQLRRRNLTLVTLALGSFCIGTSEFASMGILQLLSTLVDG